MTESKRASKERGRRTRTRPTRPVRPDRRLMAVRSERRALMRADAVLRCVAVALEYDGWTSDEPDYADAIGAARQLISRSIERLESPSGSSTVGHRCPGSESWTQPME
jgi:hypothetical protein